jgi:hypothetical protein
MSYKAHHYAIFSNLLPFHPYTAQMPSLAHCSQTTSDYVLPLMLDIKFHTHAEHQTQLQFHITIFAF